MVRRTRLPNASRGKRSGATSIDHRGTARTERGRKTRAQLLDAARIVFVREGFLHTRISDICDEAGISHGNFYTYFASKEEILQEIIDSFELELLTLDAVPADADPIERIRSANRHFLESVRDNAGIVAVIDQVVTFDADARETRNRREDAFAAALERRARQFQDDGLMDPRLDPRIAALALGGMVYSFANYMFVDRGREQFDLDDVVEQLTLLWANAMGLRSSTGDTVVARSPR